MNNKNYKDLSIPELETEKKTIKRASSFLAGLLLFILILSIRNTIQNGEFDWLMIVPISLSIIVFRSYNQVKEITREIAERG